MLTNTSQMVDSSILHLCSLLKKPEPRANGSSSYDAILLFNCIANIALAPLPVVGNALVLAAIWKKPSLRTPSFLLLGGLAFTDFCTGLTMHPLEVTYMLSDLMGNRPVFCVAGVLSLGAAAYFSIITMTTITMMSVERWLYMSRRSFFTVHRVCVLYSFWTLAPIPFIALYYTNRLLVRSVLICFITVCLTVTPVAYFKVFKIISHHQTQVQASQISQSSNQPAFNVEKYRKSVFTLLYIVTVFFLGFAPGLVWLLILNFMKDIGDIDVMLTHFFYTITLATSSINPFIYCWRIKDIRDGVKQSVRKILCRQ